MREWMNIPRKSRVNLKLSFLLDVAGIQKGQEAADNDLSRPTKVEIVESGVCTG